MSLGSNEPTVATSNNCHYPQAELRIIRAYHPPPICPINNNYASVHNCHMVAVADAERVIREMDSFNLLQHRIKGGGISPTLGNMRENIIPLGSDYNGHMEHGVFSLFLHEDVLARVYQYEMDVMMYRQARLKLGLGDPGRPPYEEAYPIVTDMLKPGPFTDHRIHATFPIVRINDGRIPLIYDEHQMPGFGHINAFPVLKTMLSIPFSILGNIHRLVRMVSRAGNLYHQDVLGLAQSIIAMWFWRKDDGYRFPDATFTSVVLAHASQGQWPLRYDDPSRAHVTFAHYRGEQFSVPRLMVPSPSSIPSTSHSKGPIILDPPDIVYDGDSLCTVPRKEELVKEDLIEGTWLPDYAPACPWNVEDWRGQVSSSSCLSEEDVGLFKTRFFRGKDTHESVNDRLFRAGLLDPVEWIKYLDLETLHT
ncbi:hypothetical protein BT96DRAFT_1016803 [Gymnopus androsaceus JB14]|uniref:Uncharacterized protein n=1 Tax=Gymnopus androsaceus JB14 TaxID=1447944 RepID=A0A6A4I1C0_9AGAR|nr:hypothetical protein BT96DRAFT_1016803 [Gymnopus androsaceus JB14]